MGFISRKRGASFFSKEPETVNWIKSFKETDTLLDIGANIGIYSLYSASRGHKVISIEPQAMNFACLVLNIMDNKFGSLIKTYLFSSHYNLNISQLNLLEGSDWGTANSSFDRGFSSHGQEIAFMHQHGSLGISMDELVSSINYIPTHIKIDVDGNELLVLKGSKKMLSNPSVQSVLIELGDDHPEYQESLDILIEAGFFISEKGRLNRSLANYIFRKK
jgi:FkbM family methyltransferase